MSKQQVSIIKKVLTILLTALFTVPLTAAAASNADFYKNISKIDGYTTIVSLNVGSAKIFEMYTNDYRNNYTQHIEDLNETVGGKKVDLVEDIKVIDGVVNDTIKINGEQVSPGNPLADIRKVANNTIAKYKSVVEYIKNIYEKKLKTQDEALQINQHNSTAWIEKGFALDMLDRHDEAITAYDKAIEINPQDSDAWKQKGTVLANLKRYDEAIAAYDKAIEINPQDSEAWKIKGYALDKLGKSAESVKVLNKAFELENSNLESDRKEALENHIKTLDEVLQINPQNSTVWIDKGLALEDLNRCDEAVHVFDKANEINPQDSLAWSSKGDALTCLNKSEAIAAYDKAIEINPQYLLWDSKGQALVLLGKPDEAVKAYDKAIEINPQNSVSWVYKGQALDKLGKSDEAQKAYDKAFRRS